MERDPYEVLGVARTATWSVVRSAYLALARRFHPDGLAPDGRLMVEINNAYEALERERLAATSPDRPLVPVGPGRPDGTQNRGSDQAPTLEGGSLLSRILAARRVETPFLDFGQYAGWRIAEVAEHDPRYLRWLSRHSSGIRYRRAIELVLGRDADIGRSAAILD